MLYSVAADESMGRMGYGQLVDRLAGFQRHTWFVEGAAGSGKSTLIKELALSLLDRGAPCVLVDNRSLRFHSIQEIDAREFAKRCRPAEVDQPLWKSRTKHGQIVFLVDAVNEIEREFSGTTKWDFVRSLIEGGHKYPVVATSRSWLEGLGYSYLRNVDRLSLLPLTEGEVQHYLDMRGAASGDAMVELHATGMSGAASNPFLLSLLADWLLDGHRDAGRPAPRSRAALLHATVARPKDEGRYSAADKQLELSGLTMDATLCGAALVAFLSSQGDMNFTATDLTALLRRVWPDGDLASSATQLFNDTQMVHRSGVPDGGDDSYALSHPALVDFGLAIGWQRGSLPSIAWDPGFLDQCMADWVGLQHDPDSTVRTLLGLGKAAPRYDLLVDVLVANRGLLSSETQAQMWQHLGMGFLSGRNARNGLVTALQRIPFWLVREGVQRGLLRRLRRASPELADEVLLAFQDRTLNPDSFQQLRRRRGRREVDANKVLTVQNVDAALVEQRIMSLRSAGAAKVRMNAASWLAANAPQAAVLAVTAALREDPDDRVRGSAATALGRIGSSDAVLTLTAVLRDDGGSNVRGSAATALGRIGSAEAVPALTAALGGDADNSVRGAAATALGRIGSPDAVAALTAVLRDDGGSNVRGSAATALGRIGSADAVPALTVALREDAEYSVRGSAATALGSIGSAVAVPALTAALREDAENSVRGSAASALGRIGRPEVLPDLQRSITSETEDYWVRASAVLALGGLEVPIDSWLIGLADNLRYTASAAHREAAKRLRGTIVNLISRRSVTAEANLWLRDVARSDSDPINRTAAIEGLSRARALDPDIVRFTIAPTSARADGRSRDTDDGVCGAAAAAVIRMAQYDEEVALSLLPSVVALITSSETWSSVVNAALAPIVNLPLETAERVLIRIKELAQSRAGTNTWFLNAVERNAVVLDQRKQSRADLRLLAQAPERMLSEFRDQRKSRFELTDVLPQRCEVALLTAIPVETRAVREVLGDLQLVPQPIQRRGRYFDMVTLPTGPDTATNVVITQATDKGGQSASAVTHDIIAEFQPQLIILVGVCGGFPEHGVSLYDVIVARNVFNYDPERLQADRGGDRPQFYRTDEQLLRLASYLHGRGDLDDAMDSSKLHVKDYASGEKVIAWKDADLRARLLQMSTDLYGIETEGHGLMHAVWETFKADQFVGGSIIKCVSDLGDEEMGVDKTAKQAAAARKAARLALDLARAFRRT